MEKEKGSVTVIVCAGVSYVFLLTHLQCRADCAIREVSYKMWTHIHYDLVLWSGMPESADLYNFIGIQDQKSFANFGNPM